MGSALSYPGIDPRKWQSLAIVTAVQVSSAGVKVDIQLLPSGVAETARVGAAFSGPGVTMYAPIHVDDEVVVAYPDGDRAAGLVVTSRLHSVGDPIPQKVVDGKDDFWLVLASGANINIVTDAGKVRLGDHQGTTAVARKGDSIEIGTHVTLPGITTDIQRLQAMLDLRYVVGNSSSALAPVVGIITSGSAKVEAK